MEHVNLMRRWGVILSIILCLSFISVGAAKETEAESLRSDQLHFYLQRAIEKTFNLETQAAVDYLQKAMDLDRENPTGYAFLALVHMFSSEASFEKGTRKKHQEAMLRYINDAVTRAQKRIDKDPNDVQACFAMALAKFSKVEWAITQKQYLTIVRETSSILDNLEKVRKHDPQNYDIYFPIGLLHYHLDLNQGFTRLISSLLITSGDRKKGLQELELTAQKGDLLKEMALAELASVYSNYEKQPGKALPIVRKLKDAFPANYNFLFVLAGVLSDLNRFEEAFVISHEIDKGIQSGKPPYASQLQSRYELLMGKILFNQKEYPKAEEYLRRALKDISPYNVRIRASAFVRLGMIYDIRKERNQARNYYSRALELKNAEGSAQVEARKYMATPFILTIDNQKS
jgi:tetratricopeptide (TPR) repeat protein